MLTLSPTLVAAQQRYDTVPVARVLVSDNPPEAPRLSELAEVYRGTEPDGVNDATWTGEGLLGRIYVDPASGNVYAQVLAANHTPASDFGAWTLLSAGQWTSGGGGAGSGCCCCYGYQDQSQRVAFFYVDSTGHAIRTITWTAGGWGPYATVVDVGAGNAIGSIACDGADPTPRVIYAIEGSVLGEVHWTGSGWSAPVVDGGSWANPTIAYGFRPATAPNGDGNGYVLVCSGAPSQTVTVKAFDVAAASWGVASSIQGYGTGYTCAFPKHQETRSDCRRAVYGWVETGPAPFGSQPLICVSPSHLYPTGFVPWRYPASASRGVKLLKLSATATGGPYWLVVGANQLYRCVADAPSSFPSQRVTFGQSQIESLKIDQVGMHRPAEIQVTLSNEGGSLKDAGVVGSANQALRRWSQVVISLGYHTAAGDETAWQIPCWIDQVVFEDDAQSGTPLVTLHCVDGWGLLDRMRFRWTKTIADDNPGDIAKGIVYHVAGDLTWIPDAQWTSIALATFTERAGEPLGAALRRLLDPSGLALSFRTFPGASDGSGWDSVQIVAPRWASTGAVYAYQQANASALGAIAPGSHPILRSALAPFVIPSATSMQVSGAATTSQWQDWAAIWDLWRDLPASVVDKALATQGATDQAASNHGQYLAPERWGGAFEANAHVGLELGDQVTITVPTAPINAMVFTVAGITTTYERGKGLLQVVKVEGSN